MSMRGGRGRLVVKIALLFCACFIFGIFCTIALERLSVGSDDSRIRAVIVDRKGLYLSCFRYLSYGHKHPGQIPVKSLTARVSLTKGSFVRLFFGRDETSYTSFCLSLDRNIPSGFWRHRLPSVPDGGSELISAADLGAASTKIEDVGSFPDMKYIALYVLAWDLMPIELVRNERFNAFDLSVSREENGLIASINGHPVATLQDASTFLVGGGLSAGLSAGHFPGCFVEEISLVGLSDSGPIRFDQTFRKPYESLAGRAWGALQWAAVGLLWWIVSTVLVGRLAVRNRERAGLFEGVVVAVAASPALLATGQKSLILAAILGGAVLFVSHMIFFMGSGGLRPFMLPPRAGVPGPSGKRSIGRLAAASAILIGAAVIFMAIKETSRYIWGPQDGYIVDQQIVKEVKIGPDTVAEICFRKRDDGISSRDIRLGAPPQWYAFRLSSEPGDGCRFVSSIGPERQLEGARPIEPGLHTVRIVVRGNTAVAWIDGGEADRFSDGNLPAGLNDWVVRRGSCEVLRDEVKEIGDGRWRRMMTLGLEILLPLLFAAVFIYLLAGVPLRRYLLPCAAAFAPLMFCGVVVLLLSRVVSGLQATVSEGGKISQTFIGRLIEWFGDIPSPAILFAGAALTAAAFFLLVVQNRAVLRWRKLVGALLALLFCWYLNGYAAQTMVGRSIQVYQRPGGYITAGRYLNGTVIPQEVWPLYSSRFPFRGAQGPVPFEKPPGTIRIIVMGGSSTWGMGLATEDTYPLRLQEILSGQGTACEVLNAGMPGYTTSMARAMLEQVLVKYHPDYVIYDFGFNDAARWAPISYADAMKLQREGKYSPPLAKLPMLLKVLAYEINMVVTPPDVYKSMVPYEDFRDNVDHLVALGRRYGFKIILVSEPFDCAPGYDSVELRRPYYDLMEEVAADSSDGSIGFLDAHGAFMRRPLDDLMTDFVHHTPHGSRFLAESIARKIVQMQSPRRVAAEPLSP